MSVVRNKYSPVKNTTMLIAPPMSAIGQDPLGTPSVISVATIGRGTMISTSTPLQSSPRRGRSRTSPPYPSFATAMRSPQKRRSPARWHDRVDSSAPSSAVLSPDSRRAMWQILRGEWGIRTPEGLHPTRFPSVRHRPLGEFSLAGPCFGPRNIVPDGGIGRRRPGNSPAKLCEAPRVAPPRPIPPGRKRSKGNRALAGARGVTIFSGKSRSLRSR